MTHDLEPDLILPPSPWDRWGWLMSTVWLVFLAFPLYSVYAVQLTVAGRVVGTALIAAFAVVYVAGFILTSSVPTWATASRLGITSLGLLVLLAAALGLVIGVNALGVCPFLASGCAFLLPRRWAVAGVAATLATSVVGSYVAGLFPDAWFFWGITLIVGGMCLLIRFMEEAEGRRRDSEQALQVAGERDRVARDVHDVLGHSLTVLSVRAEVAERMVDLDPERAKTELREIQSISRQSLAEIRATVAGLRVARLTDEVSRAESALDAAGISADLPEDALVVDPRHRITLAWALREAVTNVVRHSGASTCAVTWGEDWLQVDDDGQGVTDRKEGNGLRGLRERIGSAGGTVDIRARPDGAGTRLRVQLGGPA